jgi:PhzF family phenazine biosynthesis protein
MKLFQVDSFTSEKFKGNPAGVCILDKPLDEISMQNIALEMNLSETAFLVKTKSGKSEAFYDLRWFTPTVEVSLCGHATLASAHILFSLDLESKDTLLRFNTKSGELRARFEQGKIHMDFPTISVNPIEPPAHICEALGITPVYSGMNEQRYLFEISDPGVLRNLEPNFSELAKESKGFMVTSPSDEPQYDFLSRFFAPNVGINEDPVTGSAHSYLAPYWAKLLGKNEMLAFQASKRSGVVGCKILEGDRVELSGEAITVFETELSLN